MDRNFARRLSLVLAHEGGWPDNPKGPGRAKGATIANFRRFVKPNAMKDDLRKISGEQVATVCRRHYWDAFAGAQFPNGVDMRSSTKRPGESSQVAPEDRWRSSGPQDRPGIRGLGGNVDDCEVSILAADKERPVESLVEGIEAQNTYSASMNTRGADYVPVRKQTMN